MGERSDHDLLDLIRAGDDSAYAELWSRHYDTAVRAAQECERGSGADDVATEAFTRLLAAMRAGRRPVAAFRPYLLRTVANLAQADRQREGDLAADVADLDRIVPTSDPALEGTHRSVAVRAYQRLRPEYRHVLWYVDVEGLAPAEAARYLGKAPTVARSLASRAQADLRREFVQVQLGASPAPSASKRTAEQLGAYVRGPLRSRDHHRVELTMVERSLRAGLVPLVLGTGQLTTEWLVETGPLAIGELTGPTEPTSGAHDPMDVAVMKAIAMDSVGADTGTGEGGTDTDVGSVTTTTGGWVPAVRAPGASTGPSATSVDAAVGFAGIDAVARLRGADSGPGDLPTDGTAAPARRTGRARYSAAAVADGPANATAGRTGSRAGALVAAVAVAVTAIAATALAVGPWSSDPGVPGPSALVGSAGGEERSGSDVPVTSSRAAPWHEAVVSPTSTPTFNPADRPIDRNYDRYSGAATDAASPDPSPTDPSSSRLTPGPGTPPASPEPSKPPPSPSPSPAPSPTPKPTDSPRPTPTPSPSDTPKPTPTAEPTESPDPTDDPSPEPPPSPEEEPFGVN